MHNQYLLVENDEKVPNIPEIGSNRYDLASMQNLEKIDKIGHYVFELDINPPKSPKSEKGGDESSVVSYGSLTESEKSDVKSEQEINE